MKHPMHTCVAMLKSGKECNKKPYPNAPVALCPQHLRIVFAFAQDVVSQNWRDALKDQLDQERSQVPQVSREDSQPLVKYSRGRAPKQDTESVIYFLKFSDRIKIGFTTNLERRLQAVPHDQLLAIMPGGREEEAKLHQAFRLTRITGEWFRITPELMKFIADVRKQVA